MKKVGILTFHWATNFGAVLQAYALQRYLIEIGFDTDIINYRPYRVLLIQEITQLRNKAFHRKERALHEFRTKLQMSRKTIYCAKNLKSLFGKYDYVIAGSDQVWNESFALGAEGKPTLSYFLHGCPPSTKRISYAASLGTDDVCERYVECVRPELARFSAISVREESGKEILQKLGFDAEVVCDPTLLLTRETYLDITSDVKTDAPKVFAYILHEHAETGKIAEYVKKRKNADSQGPDIYGLNEWLFCIQHSQVVVTNSFHGVMLSLILNKPFVAVLIKGSGMNDRIRTIFSAVGPGHRAIDTYDENKLDALLDEAIPWDTVNVGLNELRERGRVFLRTALS